ncbi:MAG: hypothetical protein IJA74_05440 [Oscillospiraceae bacterium]|nr:hypothetical protein [Oscillospiraceae bacterium]
MKKVLSVMLAFAMVLSLLPAAAFAEDTAPAQKVNVVLVSGQSNANGVHGTLDVPAIVPDKGDGYWWDGNQLVDLHDHVSAITTSVGWYTPLAAEWEALTGEKVVIIHECMSGSPISKWASYEDGTLTTAASNIVAEVAECIAAIQADDTKEIVRTGYYWLQGESDAFIDTHRENPVYPTIQQYQTAYMGVHDAFVKALTVEGVDAPVGGILSCRTRTNGSYKNLEYCSMRAAQQDLANQNDDIYMASVIMEDWISASAGCNYIAESGAYSVDYTAAQMISGIHYHQSGYNAMGLEAADNMYAALTAPAIADIEVIAHSGIDVYSDGAMIDVQDNLRYIGDMNEETDENAAQIVFRTLPVSAVCDGVAVACIDADGDPVEGVIDSNGYIADINKVTDPLTVTVTAGDCRETYTLYNSDINSANESGSFHYYWDFCRDDVYGKDADGYVTVDSLFDENTLTYTAKSASYTAENGLNNGSSDYFTAENIVELKQNEAWTIRWTGFNGSNSVLLSDNSSDYDNGGRTTPYIYLKNNVKEGYQADLRAAGTGTDVLFAREPEDVDAVHTWTLTNDGEGTVTLTNDDGYSKTASFTANSPEVYSFDSVLGRFGSVTKLCYSGTIQELDIFTADRKHDCVSIEIAAQPDREIYRAGDTFQTEGMVVVKYTSDGSAYEIDAYTVSPKTIAADTTEVTVTYEERGTVYTASVPVYVKSYEPSDAPTSYKWVFGNKPTTLDAVMGDNTLSKVGNCYVAEKPIVLHAHKPWTIEWQGAASAGINGGNGILLSEALQGGSSWLYQARDGVPGTAGTYHYIILNKNLSDGSTADFQIEKDNEDNQEMIAKFENTDTVWKLTHDGNGRLNLTGALDGEVFYNAKKTFAAKDLTFNYVLGSWSTADSSLNYGDNVITYLTIYEDGATGIEAVLKDGSYCVGDTITAEDLIVTVQLVDGSTQVLTDFDLEGDCVIAATEKEIIVNVVYAGSVFSDTVAFKANATADVAEMNGIKYATINAAIAAAQQQNYEYDAVTTLEPTTINLLCDTTGGFDVGVEGSTYAAYMTQNIILNLNGHTLMLGEPPVGSGGTETNGIRVLAHSKLHIGNGIIICGDGVEPVKVGLANYGELTLDDVEVIASETLLYGINNRGVLTLSGETTVENGSISAITNEPYNYSYTTGNVDVDCVLNIADAGVTVGKVQVELNKTQGYNNCENIGVPVVNISAGKIEEICIIGDYKTPDGNITGGAFKAAVPAELCAEGYIPADNGDGTYGVKEGRYVAKIGDQYYESINAAIDAAPVEVYNEDAMTTLSATTVDLLADAFGGFDVGDESQAYATQNIILNLNGHKLTLGAPPVGSGGIEEQDNGIRVLAHSKLVINDGEIIAPDEILDNVINNYGYLELNSVKVGSGDAVDATVKNRGDLVLTGTTEIANGGVSGGIAILHIPYDYSYQGRDVEVDCTLTVNDSDVKIGKISVSLEKTEGGYGCENTGVPVVNISTGEIEGICTIGDYKTPNGNITGGTFKAAVPEELCAEGFIPAAADENGNYTVEKAYLISGSVDADGTVSITVEKIPGGVAHIVIVAQYNGEQMVVAKTERLAADGTCVLNGFTAEASYTYKIFLLDASDYSPVCEAKPLPVI